MKINLYAAIASFEKFLKGKNVLFKNGFPVIPEESLLHEIPKEILPHPSHLKAKNPAKTLICNPDSNC